MNDIDEFDRLLLQAIDETIRYCLGDINSQLIYNYLERKGISKQDIPKKLDAFVMEFEDVVGFGRGADFRRSANYGRGHSQSVLHKLKISYVDNGSRYFPDQIRKIREALPCFLEKELRWF